LVPHVPQLSASVGLFTHAASAPVPQISGLSTEQLQTIALQKKPFAGHSAVVMQAMPLLAGPPPLAPPPVPPMLEPATVADPPEPPDPPEALPPEALPALGGGGVLVPPPSSVDEHASGK
jgi:hypothetical protein